MRKRILVGISNLSSNSVGISLINLLSNIDYTKYDVDLIFASGSSNLINLIPKSVHVILSPFNKKNINFITKFKYHNKYNLSIMYDVGHIELSKFIANASKNSSLYLHKNYHQIYVTEQSFNNFISDYKILSFKKFLFPNKNLMLSFSNNRLDIEKNSHVLEYMVNDKYIIRSSKASIEVDKPNYKTLFVTAGTLNDRAKNYTLMIKMMNNLVKINNHVELWIIGDGPDLVNLKMLVNQLNLNSYIKFFGFKINPYPYISLADYYINTADALDSSTSLIEAKVLEKPIITTNNNVSDENIYVVSADSNKIHLDVDKIINDKIKFKGSNNFWVVNQHVINELDKLISNQ